MPDRLYAISFEHQREQIAAWCWDSSCGKAHVSAIDLGEHGSAIPCDCADCPHLDKQMDEPVGEVDGQPVYLRKLVDVPEAERRPEVFLAPSWLDDHCLLDHENCAVPFTVAFEGERWTVATDGRCLVAVSTPRAAEKPAAISESAAEMIARPVELHPVDLEALRLWSDCGGPDYLRIWCDVCDHANEWYAPMVPARCAGVPLDKRRLHRAIKDVSGPARMGGLHNVTGGGPMLHIRGEGWLVLVMGLREDRIKDSEWTEPFEPAASGCNSQR